MRLVISNLEAIAPETLLKLDRIYDDIIEQGKTGKGKVVIFFDDDGEITNWERVICRK
jgi:hypothetical protein